MFTYCGNSPVIYCDSSGNTPQWIKDAVKWFVEEVCEPTVNFFQSALEHFDLTISIGVNTSGTPSFWSFNGQFGISIDTKGNVLAQYSKMGGVTSGTPSISASIFVAVTNAASVFALEGDCYQFGGSLAAPIDGIPAYIAGDILMIPTFQGIRWGGQGNIGIGTPGMESHVEWGETTSIYSRYFNTFSAAREICHVIIEWSES